MTEKEMADKLRESVELTRFDDGIYIFSDDGRFGTIKNYQTDSEHYQVMFDNLTREQVLDFFEKEKHYSPNNPCSRIPDGCDWSEA